MNLTKIYYLHRGNNVPFYIGKYNIKSRLNSHQRKFGKETNLEVIDEVPIEEWKFWEIYYIQQFKSWGFKLENKNNGGGGPTFQSEITKNKISKTIKKNKTRGSKISVSNKGRISPMKGKTQNNEWKVYMSNSIKNNKNRGSKISKSLNLLSNKTKQNKNNLISKSNSKPIIQYDLEGNFIKEWKSSKEASRKLHIYDSNINCCLKGKYKSSNGFKWKYKLTNNNTI